MLRHSRLPSGCPNAAWTNKFRVRVIGALGSYGFDRERDLIRDFLDNASMAYRELVLSCADNGHDADAISPDDQGNRAQRTIPFINGEFVGGKANFFR